MMSASVNADRTLATAVQAHITRVYAENHRVMIHTARALGISRPTLLTKLRAYGLRPPKRPHR